MGYLVQGFAYSPVSWRENEHGFHRGGKHLYNFVIFNNQDCWLQMAVGTHDDCLPWEMQNWKSRLFISACFQINCKGLCVHSGLYSDDILSLTLACLLLCGGVVYVGSWASCLSLAHGWFLSIIANTGLCFLHCSISWNGKDQGCWTIQWGVCCWSLHLL
jgi:hypothetical protein